MTTTYDLLDGNLSMMRPAEQTRICRLCGSAYDATESTAERARLIAEHGYAPEQGDCIPCLQANYEGA